MTSYQYIPKSQGVNWKAIVFWGILLGVTACAFYNYREPILALIANPAPVLLWLQQNLTPDNIVAFIKNYGILLSIGAAAFTFFYGVYQKNQATKAATELLSQKQNAQTEINQAYAVANTYKAQADTYKLQAEQAAGNSLNEALMEAQNLLTLKNSEIEQMRVRYEDEVNTLKTVIADLKMKEKIVVK